MTITDLLSRLDGVKARGTGRYMARCPAHEDRSPSLSIGEAEDRILLHCFALCEKREIVAALGLSMTDLFFDAPIPQGQRPTPRLAKIDRAAIAFLFDLCALDHRLRAERIFSAASKVNPAQLNDHDLDHALGLIERGHKDITKAERLEGVTDHLRKKEFLERAHEQQRRIA